MNKELFDKRIKELSIHKDACGGYNGKRTYDFHLNEKEWSKCERNMPLEIKEAYKNGGGSELLKRKNTPPKMAHIASSSRFIYETFKLNQYEKLLTITNTINNNGKFYFEYKLPIRKGTNKEIATANMDGAYIYNSDKSGIFIEAKCHELFDTHTITFSYSYFLEGYLTGKDKLSLQLNENLLRFKIKKSAFGFDKTHKYIYFNIKKFLCDLFELTKSESSNKELVYYYNKENIIKMKHKNKLQKQIEIFINSHYISSFLKRNNITIKFIEDDTCADHSIFDRNNIVFDASYLIDGYLNSNKSCSLQLDNKFIEVELDKTTFGISPDDNLFLDIKQCICHLLSISSTALTNKDLIFLYFKPKNLNNEKFNFEKEFNSLEDQFVSFCNTPSINRILKEYNISTKLVYSTNNSFEEDPVFVIKQ